MTKAARFWDKLAEKYAKQPIVDEAAYQKKLAVTRGYFRSDMELLEFGCGTGSTALLHAPHVKHIRAVDISSKMIEIAKRKAAEHNITNITFEQSTIEALSIPGQSIDMVLGLSILHLLENKEAAIAKVRDMLKPGGLFVSSTACLGDKKMFFKIIGPIGKFLGLFPLVKVFTEQELLDSLTQGGFEIDYHWQREKGKAVFVAAKKAE